MDRIVSFRLIGTSDLLMHRDDVMIADVLNEARKGLRKEESVRGDDRSPPWTWQTYLYEDGDHVAMDCANVMAALRYGGAKVPTGKGALTFKSLSQSGIIPATSSFKFTIGGKQITMASIDKTRGLTFAEQCDAVKRLGFKLFAKRATVGTSKHIRVRPRFMGDREGGKGWEVSGAVQIADPILTNDVLLKIFNSAGQGGLCDWRPSSKTPGPFGCFRAVIE